MNQMVDRKLIEIPSCLTFHEKKHSSGLTMFPKTFIIDSQYDLIYHKEKVSHAIVKWMSIHPLLNTRIVNQGDHHFFEFDFNLNLNLENVKFLRFKTNDRCERKDFWKFIVKYESTHAFNAQVGPLWRLYLIELELNKYALVFNPHHAITDCKNAYEIVKELLKIVEDFIEFNESHVFNDEFDYEFEHPNDPRLVKLNEEFSLDEASGPQAHFVIPNSIKPSKNEYNQSMYEYAGEFVDNYGTLFKSIEEIITDSGTNLVSYKFVALSKEEFSRLVSKCKSNGVKINGCLEALLMFGYKNALKKYSNCECDELNVRYYVTINTRSFLQPALNMETMGYWIESMQAEVKLDSKFSLKTFWQFNKLFTTKLHNYIDERQFFSSQYRQVKEHNLQQALKSQIDASVPATNINNLFILSNIGNLQSARKDSFGKLRIKEFYAANRYNFNSGFTATFNSICSIDDRIIWTMSFNTLLLSENFMQKWVEEIHSIVKQIVI